MEKLVFTLSELSKKAAEYKEELTPEFILNNSMVKWHEKALERANRELHALAFLEIVTNQGTLKLEIDSLIDYGKDDYLTSEEKTTYLNKELETKTLDKIMIDLIVNMDNEIFKEYKNSFYS